MTSLTALDYVQEDVQYHQIEMEQLDIHSKHELHTIMEEGITYGTIKPFDAVVYDHNNLKEAFEAKANNFERNVIVKVCGLITS